MHVVLDIDHTLILSMLKYEINSGMLQGKNYHNVFHFITVERPYLQHFLDELFSKYDVSIWTMGTKDYADELLSKILKGRQPKYVFHRTQCEISQRLYNSPKDLRLLWNEFNLGSEFKPESTVLVDDLAENCKQPNKCILVKQFFPCEKHPDCDKTLLEVLEKLKTMEVENVTVKKINNTNYKLI